MVWKCHKTHYSHQNSALSDKHLWIVAKLWLISRVFKKVNSDHVLLFAVCYLKERIFQGSYTVGFMDSVYSPLLSDPLFFLTHSPDYVLLILVCCQEWNPSFENKDLLSLSKTKKPMKWLLPNSQLSLPNSSHCFLWH